MLRAQWLWGILQFFLMNQHQLVLLGFHTCGFTTLLPPGLPSLFFLTCSSVLSHYGLHHGYSQADSQRLGRQ